MVDLREMSNSATQLCRKNLQANSYDARRPRRPQGPSSTFWNFQGLRIGMGGQSLPRDFSIPGQGCGSGHTCRIPCGKKCRGVGRDAIRCERPLTARLSTTELFFVFYLAKES